VPIAGSVRTGVAVFSYLGGINFGVTGDYDSVPDIEVLTHGIESGIRELLMVARRHSGAGTAPVPTSGFNGARKSSRQRTQPRAEVARARR
jgi:hypothetical protein